MRRPVVLTIMVDEGFAIAAKQSGDPQAAGLSRHLPL
jgi:hypothetical protein